MIPSIAAAKYQFDSMALAVIASAGRPPQSSLAQAQIESAAVVVPLLIAASDLVDAVQAALTDHENRIAELEARIAALEAQ